jgi:hypothetical protein
MNEEIKKVIGLLQEGKITSEEAVELIAALKTSDETKRNKNGKRFMRIVVTKNGQKKVHVTMPLGIINFGLSAVKLTGSKTMNIDGENIPIDIDELKKAINDPNFTGKIVDVDEEAEGNHVEIEII